LRSAGLGSGLIFPFPPQNRRVGRLRGLRR
jgi:hypothetical protein